MFHAVCFAFIFALVGVQDENNKPKAKVEKQGRVLKQGESVSATSFSKIAEEQDKFPKTFRRGNDIITVTKDGIEVAKRAPDAPHPKGAVPSPPPGSDEAIANARDQDRRLKYVVIEKWTFNCQSNSMEEPAHEFDVEIVILAPEDNNLKKGHTPSEKSYVMKAKPKLLEDESGNRKFFPRGERVHPVQDGVQTLYLGMNGEMLGIVNEPQETITVHFQTHHSDRDTFIKISGALEDHFVLDLEKEYGKKEKNN